MPLGTSWASSLFRNILFDWSGPVDGLETNHHGGEPTSPSERTISHFGVVILGQDRSRADQPGQNLAIAPAALPRELPAMVVFSYLGVDDFILRTLRAV